MKIVRDGTPLETRRVKTPKDNENIVHNLFISSQNYMHVVISQRKIIIIHREKNNSTEVISDLLFAGLVQTFLRTKILKS